MEVFFFSNVAYANIYNSTTYARDARKLLVLEDRLKRTAEKGEKAFVLRTDFLKNMIKNPTNISVAPVWENFGFIMTAPVITPVVAALNGIKSGSINISPLINVNLLVVIISSIVAILTTGLKTFKL